MTSSRSPEYCIGAAKRRTGYEAFAQQKLGSTGAARHGQLAGLSVESYDGWTVLPSVMGNRTSAGSDEHAARLDEELGLPDETPAANDVDADDEPVEAAPVDSRTVSTGFIRTELSTPTSNSTSYALDGRRVQA